MWKFTFYEDSAGEWRWRLRGANGEIVGHGEGHTRLADAIRAAEAFKAMVRNAEIVRPKVARKRPMVLPTPPQQQRRAPQSLLDSLIAQQRISR